MGVGGIGFAGATAAAAAAAYRTGRGTGRGWGLSRPAFSMLAIGFCSKFGGGGGFAAILWSKCVQRWGYAMEHLLSDAIDGSAHEIEYTQVNEDMKNALRS